MHHNRKIYSIVFGILAMFLPCPLNALAQKSEGTAYDVKPGYNVSVPSATYYGNTNIPPDVPTSPSSPTYFGKLLRINTNVTPASDQPSLPLPPSPDKKHINSWVAPKSTSPKKTQPEETFWDLNADKVLAYNTNQVVEATGNVILKKGNEYLRADFARYYAATGWVYLKGNVDVFFGKDRLKAKEAEFDIANKVGWLKDGQVFMEASHTYFAGKRINKEWGDVYDFKEAKVTACDGDVPAWSMKADRAIVEIDGYAKLWGTSLNIKDKPVVYSPYMILPAKKDRQSGFLAPEIGNSSTNGFSYNQPFFWNINNANNLTFNVNAMTKRGAMLGAEYWTRPDIENQLWLRTDWLSDMDTTNTDSGDHYSDGLYRTNRQRFWLRGMFDGNLPNTRWKAKANLDYVSDQYFLKEFRNLPGGFNSSNDTLLGLFSRELNPWSQNRLSAAQIYREWERASVYLGASYEQDPTLGHGNASHSTDTVAQRLPELNMYLNKGRIIKELPLEINAEAQALYAYRHKGTDGSRFNIYPQLSIPIHTKYFSLEPSVGITQTMYATNRREYITGDTGNNSDTNRSIPDLNIAAYTELAKIYSLNSPLAESASNVGKSTWTQMRHSIQPRLTYTKVADVNQANLPYYDYSDRIETRDELSYSLTNVFTIHNEAIGLDAKRHPFKSISYLDFIRLNIANSYDFKEASRSFSTSKYPLRPFTDILAELEFNPAQIVNFTTRTWVSPYTGSVTRHNDSITFFYPGLGSISNSYDYRNEPSDYWRIKQNAEQRDVYLLHQGKLSENDLANDVFDRKVNMINTTLSLDYFTPLTFNVQHWFDIDEKRSMEYKVNVFYTHQCFVLMGNVHWDDDDISYGLSVELPGFWNK